MDHVTVFAFHVSQKWQKNGKLKLSSLSRERPVTTSMNDRRPMSGRWYKNHAQSVDCTCTYIQNLRLSEAFAAREAGPF